MNKAIYHAKDLIEKGEGFVTAEIVGSEGSSPRKRGAWLMMTHSGEFYGTVGGGKLEAEVEALCRTVLETREEQTVLFRLDKDAQAGLDMRCGGDVTVRVAYQTPEQGREFVNGAARERTAYLFGGGHVGLAVEPLLRYVGFETVVCDDRPEYASRERFPHAREVKVISGYDHAFDGIETDEDSYILIVTRGHMGDYEVLRDALRRPAAYVGMIGSRKKVGATMARLKEEGFTQEELDAVHSPIGLNIGAETPEEIAVSICAEMIAVGAVREH